jgi:hypothetical protein
MAAGPSGTLIAKYLLGLLLVVAGLAIVLFGVYEAIPIATLLGFAMAALGLLLIVLKIVARNRIDPR